MATEAQIAANRKNAVKGGRKVSSATLEAQEFRKELAMRIRRKAKEWMDAIEDVALGHKVKGADGNVYTKSPDPVAWQKATDRAFGKPEQAIDVTSLGEQIENVNVQFISADNPAAGEDEAAV